MFENILAKHSTLALVLNFAMWVYSPVNLVTMLGNTEDCEPVIKNECEYN
jgi:hypothetical protein